MLQISEALHKAELKVFGISEWDARQIVTKADSTSVMSIGGMTYTLYLKRHADERLLLALTTHGGGGPTTVKGVWPVPASIAELGSPFEVLTALCEDYALPLLINGTPMKLRR